MAESRFATLCEEDLNELELAKDSKKTKQVIGQSVKVLSEYCLQKGTCLAALETELSRDELCGFLRKFYAEVRRVNGEFYSKKSIITLRYGLQRHFVQVRKIDIVQDEWFKPANNMFCAMLVKLKSIGKGQVQHKTPLSKEDMSKLYASAALDVATPAGLQNKVFIDIMVYLCNRGRENLRELCTSDFIIQTDSCGLKYVAYNTDKLTKNHRGELGDDEASQGGMMYEMQNNSKCPVISFEKYMSVLNPLCQSFWQRPKRSGNEINNSTWYDNSPVGKNTLGNKMKTLSQQAGLSRVYTNHCLRATCVTTLDSVGFEARHIMGVSGHKAETSIRNYSRVDEAKKREMSMALSSNMTSSFTPQGQGKEPTPVAMNCPSATGDRDSDKSSLDVLTLSQTEQILTDLTSCPGVDNIDHLNTEPQVSAQKPISVNLPSATSSCSSAMYTIQNLHNCTVNIYQSK